MFTIADSICVKIISPSCLLTGIGNGIRLFHHQPDGRTTEKNTALNFQSKIYGICVKEIGENHQYVVAYGGRELAILRLKSNELELIQRLEFHDWINSVLLYENQDEGELEFAVLTSHSVVFRIRADNINCTWKILDKAASVEKSTLYCSRMIGREWNETTVFGGTALGELIIWTVKSGSSSCDVFHRLSGHNGVIFSIDCYLEHGLITTTSDDRSVKIWKTNFTDRNDWRKCTVASSKSMFGHTARIFQHKIIVHDSQPYIITVGEDGNVCIWAHDGSLLFRKTLSTEAAQWNLDYSEALKLLVTCGSDGNIHQISLEHILSRDHHHVEVLKTRDTLQKEEYFSKIRVLSNGVLVGLTNQNNLILQSKQDPNQWCRIDDNANDNMKCTLLEAHGNLIAIAGYKFATIYRFIEDEERCEIMLKDTFSPGIIRSLKFFETEFLVCDDKGNCSLNSLNDNDSWSISFTLPPSKERWVTAAVRHKDHLLISDRCGNLHLFNVNEGSRVVSLLTTLKHAHGKMGCTSIRIDEEYAEKLSFTTTGHDGTIKTVVFDSRTGCLGIWFTRRVPIVWIDKVIPSDTAEKSLIAGFNDNHFVLYNLDGETLFEYECGGGHRFWDIHVNYKDSTCSFYYIRNKEVHSVTFRLEIKNDLFDIPKTKWHVRPCNIVQKLPLSDEKTLLVSGGDDNLLKFTELNHFGGLRHISDMVLHVSNIKTVTLLEVEEQKVEVDHRRVLIFSAGGRAQICVTEIHLSGQKIVGFPRELTNYMLNLSDTTRKRLGKSQTIDFDPETRFMSLVAYKSGNADEIFLIAGCSDGYIRQFSYANQEIRFVASHFYNKCILNVHTFVWRKVRILLTMATDGLVCFWSLDSFGTSSTPFYELQHHQSGINSFGLMIKDDESSFYIGTGGDDQSIALTNISIEWGSETPQIFVIKTVRFCDKHTAQVNGVTFSPGENCLYTISVDQVIFKVDLSDFTIARAGYSCISDAKGISLIAEKKALVYGCNVQFLKL